VFYHSVGGSTETVTTGVAVGETMVPRILLAFVLFLSWLGYMDNKRLQREHFVDGVNEEMEQVKVVSTGVWGSTFKLVAYPVPGNTECNGFIADIQNEKQMQPVRDALRRNGFQRLACGNVMEDLR
jgi:hypothetical protein